MKTKTLALLVALILFSSQLVFGAPNSDLKVSGIYECKDGSLATIVFYDDNGVLIEYSGAFVEGKPTYWLARSGRYVQQGSVIKHQQVGVWDKRSDKWRMPAKVLEYDQKVVSKIGNGLTLISVATRIDGIAQDEKERAITCLRVVRAQEKQIFADVRKKIGPKFFDATIPLTPTRDTSSLLPATPVATICRNCGTVDRIAPSAKAVERSGAGAIAGGLVGGILGHQVGGGRGKDVTTVEGAVGGAVIGSQVGKANSSSTGYDITVRLEDGTSQIVRVDRQPELREGDKVKIDNGRVVRD